MNMTANRPELDVLDAGTARYVRSSHFQLALAGLLGLFVVGFVGFAPMEVAHGAGHDYRHSMAFPCH